MKIIETSTRAMIVPKTSCAYVQLRLANPSPGAPRNVAALISAAKMEANTAHHAMLRSPRANPCTLPLVLRCDSPMPMMTAKYVKRTRASSNQDDMTEMKMKRKSAGAGEFN